MLKKRNIPDQLVVVGISEWMTRCIKESDIFNGKKVLTINNAVDTNEFYPEKKELVRNKYKIPLYSKVVLSGSLNNSDYHKGFDLLIEAINEVHIKDLLLVIFGPTKNYLISKITKQVLNLGEIEGNNTLREIYSCADVYVSPSRMESFGKTITEAMACGIPSICFDSIGAVDLIRNQRNGFIAKSFDTKSLKKCIEEIFNLTEKELIKYKKNALNSVVNTIDNHTIAMKYKNYTKKSLEISSLHCSFLFTTPTYSLTYYAFGFYVPNHIFPYLIIFGIIFRRKIFKLKKNIFLSGIILIFYLFFNSIYNNHINFTVLHFFM